ncbi:hypothetical protein Ciccas_005560 [Cichlidogyrus casuarinus]|uniref:Uncharacterized protein n=1 Tax=Cichlidogyrus casuarinus TaxID=1844966 RepID=A0ABD2QBY6_9PLAT
MNEASQTVPDQQQKHFTDDNLTYARSRQNNKGCNCLSILQVRAGIQCGVTVRFGDGDDWKFIINRGFEESLDEVASFRTSPHIDYIGLDSALFLLLSLR